MLVRRRCNFSFTLNLGESLAFSLASDQGAQKAKRRRRPPSHLRRQERRQATFLEKRKVKFALDSADRTVESSQNGEDATVGMWKKDGDTNL